MRLSSVAVSDHDRLVDAVRAAGHLSLAEETLLRQLPMRTQQIDARNDILNDGDRPTEVCLVLDGFFFRYRMVADAQRQILSFHLPGDIPNLESLHLPVMDHALRSLTPGSIAFIALAALRQAIAEAPALADLFWRLSLLDAARTRAWLASVGRRPAYQRIAHLFCETFVRMNALGLAEETGFSLALTQTELADALGLSAVHVNRTLQQLRLHGVILSSGKFHGFTDWGRLCKVADFDQAYLFL
jgi:CRP-like cAMP-binding protein